MSFQQLSSLLNSTEFLAAVVGAVVGGLIAGGFTVWSQGQSNKAQRRRDREADNEQIKGTLQAIATELEAFKARFVDGFRKNFVEPDQQEPYAHLPKIVGFRHPYFVVFDNNASSLGRVTNAELRRKIVSTYVELKAVVDVIGHYAERRDYWERIRYQQEFRDREVAKEEIENWAERIRNSIPDLEHEISGLLVDIRKYLGSPKTRSSI
jgi:hypothetical protein